MTNTKLRNDYPTIEAIAVFLENVDMLRSTGSDVRIYEEDGAEIEDHEHDRPASMRRKRAETTVGEVDSMRASALENAACHAIAQLLANPSQNVKTVEQHFTADTSFWYVTFETEDREREHLVEWGFHVPKAGINKRLLPEISDHRPINATNVPENRTSMSLADAIAHLRSLDVDANSHFPDSATYVGDVEPEFRFTVSETPDQ